VRASADTYIELTGEQIKYDSRDAPAPVYVDLETSQMSRGDSEELYESLMDYQSVKTISKKGVTLRMSTGHSLDIGDPSLGTAAADSAARRQLAKAKKNLGATKRLEKGANTGSPMVSFWLKEIARLERQLATSSQSQRQPPLTATVHKMAGEKLGITLSDRNRIKMIKADSPCARTGIIMAGDEIIGVNGVSVEGNRDECSRSAAPGCSSTPRPWTRSSAKPPATRRRLSSCGPSGTSSSRSARSRRSSSRW